MGYNTLNKFDLSRHYSHSQEIVRVCGHIDRITLSELDYTKEQASRKFNELSYQLCNYCKVNDTPFERGY